MNLFVILPVHGEVSAEPTEGGVRLHNSGALRHAPSVSPLGCHLPVNGEDV